MNFKDPNLFSLMSECYYRLNRLDMEFYFTEEDKIVHELLSSWDYDNILIAKAILDTKPIKDKPNWLKDNEEIRDI